jgi:hypothetical protein
VIRSYEEVDFLREMTVNLTDIKDIRQSDAALIAKSKEDYQSEVVNSLRLCLDRNIKRETHKFRKGNPLNKVLDWFKSEEVDFT